MRPSPLLRSQFVKRAGIAALPLLFVALAALPFLGASAQTSIAVTTTNDELNADGDCSLREAIEAANRDMSIDGCNAGSGSDTIHIPAGVYTIALAGSGEEANQSGDYDITGNVQIVGPGTITRDENPSNTDPSNTDPSNTDPSNTDIAVIAGGAIDRLLHIHPGATAHLAGLALRDGLAPTGAPGGAILNEGVLTIDDCTINASRAGDGNNCADASAPCVATAGDGGSIYNSGVLTVTATTIRDNAAGAGGATPINPLSPFGAKVEPDGRGGGLYNAGTLLLVECEVASNHAYAGGGLYNGSQATVLATAVYSNHTTAWGEGIFPPAIRGSSGGDGGGIANVDGALDLRRSAVYDNVTSGGGGAPGIGSHAVGGSGGRGGGLYNNSVLTVTNSTITRNQTGSGGGGMWGGHGGSGGGIHNAGALTLNNATIASNQTGAGSSGVWGNGESGAGGGVANFAAARIKNTLLSGNLAVTVASDCGGDPLASFGYNLVSAAECAGVAAPTDHLKTDAQLAPLGHYGGATWTYALYKFSPAVDAGSCTDTALIPVTEDQRGVSRPQLNNCDIGAYEVQPVDAVHYIHLPIASTRN